jgi:hypothetical protein
MPHAKIRFLEYRTEDKEAPGNYGLLDQTLAIMLVPVSMPIIYAVAELSRMTLAVAAVAVVCTYTSCFCLSNNNFRGKFSLIYLHAIVYFNHLFIFRKFY